VVGFKEACHKHFRTLEQAEAFIADWKKMSTLVKAKKKEELSDCHQPAQIRGTPVPLSLKIECKDGAEELATGMRRTRIQD
jgi:hypothetical protein